MEINEPSLGSVIMIPMTQDLYTVSQIVFPGISFYLIGFEGVFGVSDKVESILKTSPILGAWTNDAEIYKARWKITEVTPIYYTDFLSIEYKYMSGGKLFRQSFDGRNKQLGRHGDEKLPYKSSISPLIFGNALCAANGYGEWKSHYEKLLLR